MSLRHRETKGLPTITCMWLIILTLLLTLVENWALEMWVFSWQIHSLGLFSGFRDPVAFFLQHGRHDGQTLNLEAGYGLEARCASHWLGAKHQCTQQLWGHCGAKWHGEDFVKRVWHAGTMSMPEDIDGSMEEVKNGCCFPEAITSLEFSLSNFFTRFYVPEFFGVAQLFEKFLLFCLSSSSLGSLHMVTRLLILKSWNGWMIWLRVANSSKVSASSRSVSSERKQL